MRVHVLPRRICSLPHAYIYFKMRHYHTKSGIALDKLVLLEYCLIGMEISNLNLPKSTSETKGLELIPRDSDNILSIGVSTGLSAELQFCNVNPTVKVIATTIDSSGYTYAQNLIEDSHLEGRITIKLEDVSEPMSYKDNQFDYIYARLVLHYLDSSELDRALKEIFRVLKQGATAYIVVRSTECPDIKPGTATYDPISKKTTCVIKDYNNGSEITYSRYFHTIESISAHLLKAGFSVESCAQYDEQLYIDFQRTVIAPELDNLIEVVAVKK